MKKKFSTNDLIGMKIKNADKLAPAWLCGGLLQNRKKQDMQDADRSYEWLVSITTQAL